MIIANPIYDIVFKYLMEDERIYRIDFGATVRKNDGSTDEVRQLM